MARKQRQGKDGLLVGFGKKYGSNSSMGSQESNPSFDDFLMDEQDVDHGKTIAALAAALHDLQADFRAKTSECEALQQTVAALSTVISELDIELKAEKYANEKLHMKMQAVTFVERGDARWREDEEIENEADGRRSSFPRNKKTKKVGGATPSQKRTARSYAKTVSDPVVLGHLERFDRSYPEGEDPVTKPETTQPPIERVNVDDAIPSVPEGTARRSADESKAVEENELVSLQGPGQAAFYQIIFERDLARKKCKNLSKELSSQRSENKMLKDKLSKSTALVELAYHESDSEESERDTPSSAQVLMKSLSQNVGLSSPTGSSARKKKEVNTLTWLMSGSTPKAIEAGPDPKSKATSRDHNLQEYVEPFISDAADKAGGFDSFRVEM